MSNPPKQKGTGFEREVMVRGKDRGLEMHRQPASAKFDIFVRGSTGRVIEALATRPDYGYALVSIRLDDFLHLLREHGDSAHIECKRFKKFAHHTIFDDKFGG